MDKPHDNSQKGGVFLGVLVGVAVTLLVATKKGRRMMHNLSDEGLAKLGDWEHILKDVVDAIEDGDFEEGDDYVGRKETSQREDAQPSLPQDLSESEADSITESQSDYVPTVHQSPPQVQQHAMPLREQPPWSSDTSQYPTSPLHSASQPPMVHGDPVTHSSEEQAPQVPAPQHTSHPVSRPRTTSRRFFRGIPRR